VNSSYPFLLRWFRLNLFLPRKRREKPLLLPETWRLLSPYHEERDNRTALKTSAYGGLLLQAPLPSVCSFSLLPFLFFLLASPFSLRLPFHILCTLISYLSASYSFPLTSPHPYIAHLCPSLRLFHILFFPFTHQHFLIFACLTLFLPSITLLAPCFLSPYIASPHLLSPLSLFPSSPGNDSLPY